MATYGMMSERIPAIQKCVVNCPSLGLSVYGLLEQESEASLENTFEPAFGMSTVQDKIKGLLGAFQSDQVSSETGVDAEYALISALNTQQIYAGSEPPAVDLPLLFVALEDPAREVDQAINALKEMALPSLVATAVGSRPPARVTINLKRQILLTKGRIESLAVNDFGAWSSSGTLWAKVMLRIKAMQMPSRKNVGSSESLSNTQQQFNNLAIPVNASKN